MEGQNAYKNVELKRELTGELKRFLVQYCHLEKCFPGSASKAHKGYNGCGARWASLHFEGAVEVGSIFLMASPTQTLKK